MSRPFHKQTKSSLCNKVNASCDKQVRYVTKIPLQYHGSKMNKINQAIINLSNYYPPLTLIDSVTVSTSPMIDTIQGVNASIRAYTPYL